MTAEAYRIANVDLTIIAQQPKLAPHIEAMRNNIAADLDTKINHVSVKATTTEAMGFTGREEGIAVMCTACLYNAPKD